MQHHAFVIPAEIEKGIQIAQAWVERELKMQIQSNPDVITLRHGLLSVEDARKVVDIAAQAPISGDTKAIIVAAQRVYHESQNALLKLFEEPPRGTYVFLILPNIGSLLPTLRSRVQILDTGDSKLQVSEAALEFMKATKEKRSAIIRKLATGKDEDDRRENRDTAIEILNGVEQAAYAKNHDTETIALLIDIAELRAYLHGPSAPLRMILEHISLVLPKGLK
ncbi:MAG TPA: hypothetical protein VM103_00370 [Candidatus Paceibacterota bacterium]|nr:hypothetical protein [Candidatus Paceibacterota bacterium]